jgi:hypothetical protein
MSELRRRDPVRNIRYGQSCSCGGYCDHPEGWTEAWDDDDWSDDDWDDDWDDNWADDQVEDEDDPDDDGMAEPESREPEGWTAPDFAAAALAMAAAIGLAIFAGGRSFGSR